MTDKTGLEILVNLGDDASTELANVGGKGANLGKLIKAAFPVPPGIVVTTEGYTEFIRTNGLAEHIDEILEGIDYEDIDTLETETARIRALIIESEIPDEMIRGIARAYAALGDEPYVAVRSSGTAEDLEDASFAGQHDTYLDVKGSDAVLDAVHRCWASLWTARATAYRRKKGFDRGSISIAVVVQKMVEPDVSGVMFTGNPMNARADEYVINAGWGLGESVVSGMITPDEYVVSGKSFEFKRRNLGSKELKIVRDPNAPTGTVEETVPQNLQAQYTLSDDEARQLAELGKKVTDYYGGLPQDTEWAMANGSLFLLQSRPITGVPFTWEEDLEMWPSDDGDEDAIWSRAWADEFWSGVATPLFWSVRGDWVCHAACEAFRAYEMGELADLRWLKYHKGTVYFNTKFDKLLAQYLLPPDFRAPMLNRLHPSELEEAIGAPFDLGRCITMLQRIEESEPGRGIRSIYNVYEGYRGLRQEAEDHDARSKKLHEMFPTEEALRAMENSELKERVDSITRGITASMSKGWTIFALYAVGAMALLESILKQWYDGDNASAYSDVLSGFLERTRQFVDDNDFHGLANMIQQSETLSALMNEHEGGAFFEALENHAEGRAFLAKYQHFFEVNFFRGHADRDIYYARRADDPMIDYRALRMLVTAGDRVPMEEMEDKTNQRREAAIADVIQNLESKPLGPIKVAAFKVLQDYCMKFLSVRDDDRGLGIDATTYLKKILLSELGRRAVAGGLLIEDRDFYFLSLDELYGLLEGTEPAPLCQAKAAARKKDVDLFLTHEEDPPHFLKGSMPMALDQPETSGNALKGIGTSPGTATGRARIVPTLEDIGRLEKGDVLICNATDPGWTPVFSVACAVVAQTGGTLAHFSCLSREYGIPALSLPNAMQLIEDGAIVTVVGDTGEVRIESKPGEEVG